MTDEPVTTETKALALTERVSTLKKAYIPLLRELIVNGKKLTDDQIVGRAAFAASEGLDPITEVHTLVDRDGHTMSHTMSIGGRRRKNQEQVGPGNEITVSFLEMTPDELAKVPGAAIGFRCFLRDGQSYGQWQKRLLEIGKCLREAMGGTVKFDELIQLAGPAPVAEGVGIFYKAEYNDYKDRNFNPIERAKKRAEVNARNHRFSTNTPVYDGAGGALVDGDLAVIDGQFSEAPEAPRQSIDKNLADLGFGAPTKPEPTVTVGATDDNATGYVVKADPADPNQPVVVYPAQQPELFPPDTASAPMTIEEARDIRNSEGMPYGNIPSEKLRKMAIGLGRVSSPTPEQSDKALAIQLILADRKAAESE